MANLDEALQHLNHMVQVMGIEHVGIGSDFDGGGGLSDCFDVSDFPKITAALLDAGYSQEAVRKIWGGNLLRVMSEVQAISEAG